jgi:hypothetical protein
MEGTIYRSWETQGVAAPRANPRAAAPGALAPKTTPMGREESRTMFISWRTLSTAAV